MPNGVYALMNSVQTPSHNPLVDSTHAETSGDELSKPNHSMLVRRQLGDGVVGGDTAWPTGRSLTV